MTAYPTINRQTLNALRAELGAHFPRILSYFAEDGIKSVEAIEEAVRIRDTAALVRPAHTLKGESLQFGAEELGYAAEHVEMAARDGVEAHSFPRDIAIHCDRLRPLFEEALAALQQAAAPVVAPTMLRRPAGGFGRKVG